MPAACQNRAEIARIEHQAGWSIRKFVKTARRCGTLQIQVGAHTVTAADLQAALDQIHGRPTAH
jgi:hypothetical protein